MPITKKFINNPETVVDESLLGLVNSSAELKFHPTCPRVVLRSDIDKLKSYEKVTLVAGGGSGHEPYAAGYVGKGMLTAAVCGDVFASPPSHHVTAALEATDSKGGTILFIINYTGDRLNFGLAVERAKRDIRVVTITDDIALNTVENPVEPRGLAATVLMIKICGAMAETGATVDTIESIANRINDETATIGVSLAACSIPGQGPVFELDDDKFEVGLGIHGEPGHSREPMQHVNDIVNKMMTKLCQCQKLKMMQGSRIILLLNNLGSVSQIEMNVLQDVIIRWCHSQSLTIVRMLSGTYMTSLDGYGISISILNLFDETLAEHIDANTTSPGWKHAFVPLVEYKKATVPETLNDDSVIEEIPVCEETAQKIRNAIDAVCEAMISHEDILNKLDGAAGDGDCGSTFRSAAQHIRQYSDKLATDQPARLLQQISQLFEREVGGTSGAIYALMLSAASDKVSSTAHSSADWALAIESAMNVVMLYGKAQPGDRTMVDSLYATVQNLKSQSHSIDWDAAITAAEEAAKSTAKIKASRGRASYTSHEVQCQQDAGAVAIATWLRTAWDSVKTSNK